MVDDRRQREGTVLSSISFTTCNPHPYLYNRERISYYETVCGHGIVTEKYTTREEYCMLFPETNTNTNTAQHESDILSDLERKEADIAAYEQAIQLTPHEASFHYHKAHILEQVGRLAEAQRAYEEAYRLGYNG